jgi:hypothetical protein
MMGLEHDLLHGKNKQAFAPVSRPATPWDLDAVGNKPTPQRDHEASRVAIADDRSWCFAGTSRADDGIRTHDLLHGKQTL